MKLCDTVYKVIFKWKHFQESRAVRDFENNIFKNEAGDI